MPAAKLSLKAPLERNRFKGRLLSLPDIAWQEKQEQYCDYRLDGKVSPAGWLRAKQFTNGTLYLEAGDEALLSRMTDLLSQDVSSQSLLTGLPSAKNESKPVKKQVVSGLLDIHGDYIGTDESGKGDYFGPLVIAGVFVNDETQATLSKLGVMDSKKLSDKQIGGMAGEIVDIIGKEAYAVVEIGPKTYNSLYAKFKSGGKNLNHLLAWGHATAIENVLAHYPECPQAIADQFGNEHYILSQLKEKGGKIRLHQTHRAEANIGVAAASILARSRFTQKMAKLSEQFQVSFPFGAGPQVKLQAQKFIQRHGFDKLSEVAKLHFKTTEELKNSKNWNSDKN